MTNPTWRELFAEYVFTASLASLSENHREIAECALTVALEAFLDATGIDQAEESTPIYDYLATRPGTHAHLTIPPNPRRLYLSATERRKDNMEHGTYSTWKDNMEHGTYSTWKDDSGAVRMECNSCKEAHTFKSDYFAKQWANQHGYVPVRLIGLV